jgi:chromosome segregation ATPase
MSNDNKKLSNNSIVSYQIGILNKETNELIQKLIQENTELKQDKNTLQEQLNQYQNEMNNLNIRFMSDQKIITELKTQNNELKIEIEELKEKINKLEEDKKISDTKIENLNEDNKKLNNRLDKMDNERNNDILKKQIKEVLQDINCIHKFENSLSKPYCEIIKDNRKSRNEANHYIYFRNDDNTKINKQKVIVNRLKILTTEQRQLLNNLFEDENFIDIIINELDTYLKTINIPEMTEQEFNKLNSWFD